MNQYKLIEAPNMQSNTRKYLMSGTPRAELIQNGITYSNLDDLNAEIICRNEDNIQHFTVKTHLVDINQQAPASGEVPVTIDYMFSDKEIVIQMKPCADSVCFILPVIAAPSDKVKVKSGRDRWKRIQEY